MRRKHYLIYGHGGSYNHGSEAITRGTIEFLRKVSPNCFITLSTHFPGQDIEVGLLADEMVTRNPEGKTNQEVYQATLDRITSDTTVIHVGGDNYCYNNWQRYAQIHEAAKKCGGKSIFWGCSIDSDNMDEEMLRVLREHDLILARESITFESLKERGVNNVLLVSDIAFAMEPVKVDFDLKNYVVINLSPLVFRKNAAVVEAVQRVIRYILTETTYNIALVPHVVMPMDNDCDALAMLEVSDSERVVRVTDKFSAKQYKYIISKAELCVAARTHVTIAAYSSYVPTLAIGYSTKAQGIAKDLGFLEYVVDIMDENIEEGLLAKFVKLINAKLELKERLHSRMEYYKGNVFPEQMIECFKGD